MLIPSPNRPGLIGDLTLGNSKTGRALLLYAGCVKGGVVKLVYLDAIIIVIAPNVALKKFWVRRDVS